jgi:hypothetical protein
MVKINEEKDIKDLKTLLDCTCESINNINELSSKFNIDDDLFRKLFDKNSITGATFVRENFLEIYNSSVKK